MKVLTTVGTSIFINYQKKRKNLDDNLENIKLKPYDEWNELKEYCDIISETILEYLEENFDLFDLNAANYNDKSKYAISAEIKSIFKLKEKYQRDFSVHLIATDTILSVLAAEIISMFLKQHNIDVVFNKNKDIIKDLQVTDKRKFEQEGLYNLMSRLYEIINSLNTADSDSLNIIFNITGGYKAIIPYITLFGQIFKVPIYYIFEQTDNLINIPQLPIEFDFSILEEYYYELNYLKNKKRVEYSKFADEFEEESIRVLIKNNFVKTNNDYVNLTPIGIILFNRYEELFNSDRHNRQNLLSNLIELKLFKFFVNKYNNKAYVEHSKKITVNRYEIDIYIEESDKITAIEVKPGSNIPIWERRAKKKSLEYKLKKGAFYHLIKMNSGKKLIFLQIYLYRFRHIDPRAISQLKELHKQVQKMLEENNASLEWFFLRLPKDYSTNTHWDVKGRIEPLIEIKGCEKDV